jgi:hypothetical protein
MLALQNNKKNHLSMNLLRSGKNKKFNLSSIIAAALAFTCLSQAQAQAQPHANTHNQQTSGQTSEWSSQQIKQVLDKTLFLTLAPDLSGLSAAELNTLKLLLEVGPLLHDIYLQAQHKDALSSKANLLERLTNAKEKDKAEQLLKLYRIFKGPIATSLDNKRVPYLSVADTVAGKNRYPWGIKKNQIEAELKQSPQATASLLHPRSVVRSNNKESISKDMAVLAKYPVLDTLHPGLRANLSGLNNLTERSLYAVPYSVAYADNILAAYQLLYKASETIASEDKDFADYLKNRARDLLSDDYEAGDASWITGRFNKLNAQIGAYETYDDGLYGTKTSFSMSLLVKDELRSKQLRSAITDLQALEDSLPYDNHKKVSSDIPIGVYNVIADFGQARGTNTASILPNESHITRKYGRTILLRYNIMTNPAIFATSKARWDAVVADEFNDHLNIQSNFQRTLWHEIGHYMGPSVDKKGRTLDIALENNSNLFEEMKSDLVSLYGAAHLRGTGYHDDQSLQAVYAGGILRTLQKVKPRRNQAYQTMQLMTMNYFLQHKVLTFDADKVELTINYAKYPEVVKSLLTKVLDVQYQGDKGASDRFVEQYTGWNDELHAKLAKKMQDTKQPIYRMVSYQALGE